MSKRSRPCQPSPKSKNRTFFKVSGHGSFKKKRHPTSPWILNGSIT